MNRLLPALLFLFCMSTVVGQNTKRIKVKGLVFSEENDIEAVTIFNTSSNKGTITNNEGEFELEVALNDIIEISALQFKPATITIGEEVIKFEQLKIQLVEQVNQLDAVTLSAGLTGNLATDITNAKTVKPITIDMGDLSVAYEYQVDRASDNSVVMKELKGITSKGELNNGINFAALLGISRVWFKWKEKPKLVKEKPKTILDVFTKEHLSEACNMSVDKVEAFIVFVEEKGVQPELLKPEKEMQLLEYLMEQSKLFLNELHVKK
ncbi:carboxypeptidase-like regulatory domain-containing protein [Aestuariivivens insulae]|uniref:carboxypeptidase-like regulatory domain-containing protein n=1 Tax=Aestuariivivens insulae TaxID=1621988 RepID=UPI001F590569|nr:carboxypeptidase-like regulatory domain-containing protein [Aestuariivivens insulae]